MESEPFNNEIVPRKPIYISLVLFLALTPASCSRPKTMTDYEAGKKTELSTKMSPSATSMAM